MSFKVQLFQEGHKIFCFVVFSEKLNFKKNGQENSKVHNFLQDLYNYQLNQLTNDTFWLQEAARLQREQTWTPATMSPAPGSSSSRESSLDPTSCVVHTASASVLRYLLNGNWHVLVVHSFLKQCLHDLHFMKTRYFSPNLL